LAEISVIIPTLNEATALPRLLGALAQQSGVSLEVIVADGGSTDGTRDLARRAGARVVESPRGRGRQMNAGASAATAGLLLFLHADSLPESNTLLRDAAAALRAAIGESGHDRVAGHFPLRFERAGPGHDVLFRFLEGKSALSRPYTINGDQGALLTARWFRELGGYDERLPFLEDQQLAARVFAAGRWLALPGRLATSARRFEAEGHRERLTLMALIMGLHAGGFDDFFEAMPAIYAEQPRAERLDLRRWHAAIRRAFRTAGAARTFGVFRGAGRFVRENAWQLFFRRDVVRGLVPAHPALDFYDRRVQRWLDRGAVDALATVLLAAWFYGWLRMEIALRRPV
jgi:rSAM/selenodomain-associated transferase 2